MSTTFPDLVPSSRSWDPGQFPVKTYTAQDGGEARILYGDKAFGAKMQLVYQNISNDDADDFAQHYRNQKGTYKTFALTGTGALSNWNQSTNNGINPPDNKWRYAQAPQLQSTYPGYTTVTISLVSALNWQA